MVAKGHLIEALDLGAEAFDIFLLATGGDGGQGAAMKRPFKGDDMEFFRMSEAGMIFTRHFNRTFQRLRTRIGEKHLIGKGGIDKALRQPLTFRNGEQIGDMPDPGRLVLQGVHQMGMGMAKRIDRDTAAKVEIAFARSRIKPDTFPALEGKGRTCKSLKKG